MKRALALCLTVVLSVGPLLAADKADLAAIYRIKDEGFNRSQVMDILSYLTDVHGPRLSGSPNMRKAQEWAQQKFREWGLANVHTEKFDFGRSWHLKRFAAHMVEPTYSPLIAFPKAWTPGLNGVVKAEVIRVDIATEADFDKYKGKLKGLYVATQPPREVQAHFNPQATRHSDEALARLAMAPEPGAAPAFGAPRAPGQPPAQRPGFANQAFQRKVMAFYVQEGVAATIEPGRGDGGTIFVQSGSDRNPNAPPTTPQIVMAVEHYNRICRILAKNLKVSLEMEYQAEIIPPAEDYNVLAEIPGGDKKDELVMLGAHFDSWHGGTGATDNAAGSAVTMEAIRIIKALGLQPRRTIRIGLWSGEEQGLLGSRAYVNEHFASRPTPPPGVDRTSEEFRRMQQTPPTIKPDQAKVAGYWNLDNGTGKIRGIYLQGNEEVRPIFEAWLAPFKDLGATTLSIRNTGGTDHLSFDAGGMPGFQFIQDEVEYDTRTHHSNMDVYDRIQRGDMIQSAVIMASFVYHTAMRDEKLPRKPLRQPAAGRAGGPPIQ
jgi:hypothetical protein